MKAILTVEMNNDAFAIAEDELSRILQEAADAIKEADFSRVYDRSLKLRDYNGNLVGALSIIAG